MAVARLIALYTTPLYQLTTHNETVPLAERRSGAELMYHGGDVAEPLLAIAILSGRRPGPGVQ